MDRNDSAFPKPSFVGMPGYDNEGEITCSDGLTKREYLAALVMQQLAGQYGDGRQEMVAKVAISYAEALMAELEKAKE